MSYLTTRQEAYGIRPYRPDYSRGNYAMIYSRQKVDLDFYKPPSKE